MPRRVHDFQTSRFGGRAEVTGYRDAQGRWNQINPRTGGWFVGGGEPGGGSRHRGKAPTDADLRDGRDFGVHVKYRGTDFFYTLHSPMGISGRRVESDFRARIRAGYFKRHGTRRT